MSDPDDRFAVSHFGTVPDIPWPSSKLQEILNRYYSENGSEKYCMGTRKKAAKVAKKKKMNAFMAFRSYYSKSIIGVQRQKRLSSELAKIWKTEPNHHVWSSYAIIYNAVSGSESFVDWLSRSIGFIYDDVKEPPTVEDIFLEGERFTIVESQSFLY